MILKCSAGLIKAPTVYMYIGVQPPSRTDLSQCLQKQISWLQKDSSRRFLVASCACTCAHILCTCKAYCCTETGRCMGRRYAVVFSSLTQSPAQARADMLYTCKTQQCRSSRTKTAVKHGRVVGQRRAASQRGRTWTQHWVFQYWRGKQALLLSRAAQHNV